MSRFHPKNCVLLTIFCVCAASLFGQGTDLGAVRGLVTDSSPTFAFLNAKRASDKAPVP